MNYEIKDSLTCYLDQIADCQNTEELNSKLEGQIKFNLPNDEDGVGRRAVLKKDKEGNAYFMLKVIVTR